MLGRALRACNLDFALIGEINNLTKNSSNLDNFEGFNAGTYGKFLGLSGHISITFVS